MGVMTLSSFFNNYLLNDFYSGSDCFRSYNSERITVFMEFIISVSNKINK